MTFPPDLVEMLSAFADAGVRYLVIGGHAVSLHARPRTTKDLDLWLDAAPENVVRACSALVRFGVPPELVASLRSAKPEEIVWMGRPPARVDFLQAAPGLDFERSWARRVTVTIDSVSVPFVSREDLILNKRTVGRPQDRRDVRALERAAESVGDHESDARSPRAAHKPATRKRR